jgi:predicted NUDIX family NTP pyrophosphohydrolase
MPKVAAGCVVRYVFGDELRYLIVHPSGSYNRKKPWSIPKGLLDAGEEPSTAALRETREETGLECRILKALGEVRYKKSGKRVLGFLAEPVAPPPGKKLEPGDWEIDQAEFVTVDEALRRLHPDQRALIERAESES